MELRQKDVVYKFYDIPYHIHLTMDTIEDADGLFRTNYKFKFTEEDERDTNFYCITSEYPEVVFSYIIDAYRKYGKDDWKKHLKFNAWSKQLEYDGEIMPV